MNNPRLRFKTADSPGEYDQIYQLNYETFVEEIPQHHENPDRRLIDKFNDENTYFICLDEHDKLAGMLCVRDRRPFSLDAKVANLDSLIPIKGALCEVRLLSVRKEYRHTRVLAGLLEQLYHFGETKNYQGALISGTTRQEKLYRHLGFTPFAPPVGPAEAQYIPMFITIESFRQTIKRLISYESSPI